MQTAANRLAKERSAYLRSAAHQPVRWFPWSSEAFQEAQRLDRPILLDIGASWCHWCHVIDRESYENEEIAKIINDHFIPVKVDRDERPDIDSRYQMAVGALTGQGGWPLMAFLTPKGDVFYGATYLPPDDSYGRPGFKKVLKRTSELYKTRKQEVLEDAKKVAALFEEQKSQAPPELPTDELLQNTLYVLKHHFDFTQGGFGNAPKFYHASALEFLLNQFFLTRQNWIRSVVEKSLYGIGKGGVHDQLGGGFHRYSVDERWVVPHFEKMSYDNAPLLAIYSRAFQLLGRPLYREAVMGIIHWSREWMSDQKRGGFYASQDADINLHDDGDYYTWTRRETEALLNKEEAQALLPYFDIESQGEMVHDPSRNVLFVAKEPEILARELELKPQEVIKRIESGKRKLLAARNKRKVPFVDRTLYSNWNGMWVRGYLAAYRAFQDPELKNFALRTLDRFMKSGFQPEKGVVRFLTDDEAPLEGLLEDQAEMLAAALDAFEVTGERRYFDFAVKLAEILLERFAAPEGGFFDIASGREEGHLRFRQRKIQDSPVYSPNATAACALLKLYHLTQDKKYLEKVEVLLRFFQEEAKSAAYFAAGYMNALDFYLKGVTKVVIAGEKGEAAFKALHETALFNFRPHLAVFPLTEETRTITSDPSIEPFFLKHRASNHPVALVCSGSTCKPITDSPEELKRQILESKSTP